MTFQETITKIKEQLQGVITADNAQVMTEVSKNLDSLTSEHDTTVKKYGEIQSAYVEVVKNTSFAKPSDDNPANPEKSVDEVMQDALTEILNKRKRE